MPNTTGNRYFHSVTAAIILGFALLGLAAGPSAAIVMIPRYDWWQLSESSNSISNLASGEYDLVQRNPYSMKLESQHVRKDACTSLVAGKLVNQTCENQNLSPILQIRGFLDYSPSDSLLLRNISLPRNRAIAFAVDHSSETSEDFWRLAYALTPMDFVVKSLVNERRLPYKKHPVLIKSEAATLFGKEKWKQPLVAVDCAPFYWQRTSNETSATFTFGSKLYDNFNVSLNFSDTLEKLKKLPGDDAASHPTTSFFMDIQHVLPVPITASIIFASSFMADWDRVPEKDPDHGQLLPWMEIYLCLVKARWVEAEVWLDEKESLEAKSQLGFPTSDIIPFIRQNSGPEDTIKMTVEWLRDIGVPRNSVSTPGENPVYQQGSDNCTIEGMHTVGCLPAFLAVYLAEALSQSTGLQFDRVIDQDKLPFPSPGPNSTVIYNTRFEHLYAYGFGRSITIVLAFTALLLQVFIALIHLVLTVCVRQLWHCSAWGDFGQLLALALRSNASDELHNVGAGVQSSHTWKLMAVVRDVGQKRRLEMVVGPPKAISRQGQTNTDVEDRGPTQMRIPQAGIKYQ
ncbi:hypothetical protein BGZ63DRAFT_426180 [Mariannaea sp. PMI_226]|nr:hypothetical protein BGZ63DRAFT_426180 [Mariannaea sp. PMI_226]